MRTVDLSPLYRSFVGVNRLSDLIDAAARADNGAPTYPPFNIEEVGENAYRIELAVAGFGEDDVEVEVRDSTLFVSGRKTVDEDRTFLHRGIAERAFERRFQLADHVVVTGASLRNGLLVVDLERELPERLKPRKIAVTSDAPARPAIANGDATTRVAGTA